MDEKYELLFDNAVLKKGDVSRCVEISAFGITENQWFEIGDHTIGFKVLAAKQKYPNYEFARLATIPIDKIRILENDEIIQPNDFYVYKFGNEWMPLPPTSACFGMTPTNVGRQFRFGRLILKFTDEPILTPTILDGIFKCNASNAKDC